MDSKITLSQRVTQTAARLVRFAVPTRTTSRPKWMVRWESDPNAKCFQRLTQNQAWWREHYNNYVAIVDGQLVDEGRDFDVLLERVRLKYPDRHRYFGHVSAEQEIVDVPGIFAVEER